MAEEAEALENWALPFDVIPELPPPRYLWDPGALVLPAIAEFEPCPSDPACPHCGKGAAAPDARDPWGFVDHIYCISLRSREDRYGTAVRQLHRLGLCRRTLFLRPEKGPRGGVVRSIWESHRTCLRHALQCGSRRALVLEDDIVFPESLSPGRLAALARALQTLPAAWQALYLGHLPLRAYFVRRNVMRTVSACTHAYIASPRLMRWLAETKWEEPGWARSSLLGYGLDSAYSQLPGMYAVFPMLAVQSDSPSDHLGSHKSKRVLGLIEIQPLVRWAAVHAARPLEWLQAVLSPFWWIYRHVVPGFGRGRLKRGAVEA